MLTLNAAGKSGNDAVNIVREALTDDAEELKILIDGPEQSDVIKQFLETKGYNNIFPEDDDGTLYLMASKVEQHQVQEESISPETLHENSQPANNTTGILISYDTGKQKFMFLKKLLSSLTKSRTKPDIIALVNNAVNLAAYNTPSCDDLKQLEASGVQILISESCADRTGITEAVGAGVVVDMSEIFDELFSCEKVVSL